MSFLDSLENSLKTLESREEQGPGEAERRRGERSRALAAAPWAEKLKTSPWTNRLFEQAAAAGHRIRAKIYIAWVENTLRLEVRGRALEIRPTAEGIVSEYTTLDGGQVNEAVDLQREPEELLHRWLAGEKAVPQSAPSFDDEANA